MVIHKYIIHVLDRNSEGPILNDFEGKNNTEVEKFLQKIIKKINTINKNARLCRAFNEDFIYNVS